MFFLDIKSINLFSHIALNYYFTFIFRQGTRKERDTERGSLAGKWNCQHNHTLSDRGDSVRQWLQMRTVIVRVSSWPMLLVFVHLPRTENSIATSPFPVLLEIFRTRRQEHFEILNWKCFSAMSPGMAKTQSHETTFRSVGPCMVCVIRAEEMTSFPLTESSRRKETKSDGFNYNLWIGISRFKHKSTVIL